MRLMALEALASETSQTRQEIPLELEDMVNYEAEPTRSEGAASEKVADEAGCSSSWRRIVLE